MSNAIEEVFLLKDFHYNEDTNTYIRKEDGSILLPATYNVLIRHIFDMLLDDYYTLKVEKRKQMIKERQNATCRPATTN